MSAPPVALVSTYPPEHCGVGRDAFQLVRALRSRRNVRVFVNRTAEPPLPDPSVVVTWRKNDVFYPVRVARRLRRAYPRRDPVVHVMHHFFLYGGPATVPLFFLLALLLRLEGFRTVVQFQSVVDPDRVERVSELRVDRLPRGLLARLLGTYYRGIARFCAGTVVCTRSMRELLVGRYGLDPRRVWVVPVGWQVPDREAESGSPVRTERGRAIVFHGFLDPTKGLEVLLDAFDEIAEALPDVTLVFAGELSPQLGASAEPYLASLRRRDSARRRATRIRFTGFLDGPALSAELGRATAFALPYTMLFSHGGSASLSRIASVGRPVVASRISRFDEELRDGETALLVPPGRPKELAEALRRVLTDGELARRLGENLRRLAARRTWEESARLLDEEVYAQIAPREGASAR